MKKYSSPTAYLLSLQTKDDILLISANKGAIGEDEEIDISNYFN